jgi:hypothetical protein
MALLLLLALVFVLVSSAALAYYRAIVAMLKQEKEFWVSQDKEPQQPPPIDHSFMIELSERQGEFLSCLDHSEWHAVLWEQDTSISYYCFKCGCSWTHLAVPSIVYHTPSVSGPDGGNFDPVRGKS